MKLFADENIAAQIVEQLRQLGHDVLYPRETGLSAEDDIWLEKARSEERTLVTDDKDYDELVFRRKLPSGGVVLLRLHRLPLPDRLRWLQSRWSRILSYPPASLVVVTERKIRARFIRPDVS
jgi:predicted nuclease of predicted toxin-antitoxin system